MNIDNNQKYVLKFKSMKYYYFFSIYYALELNLDLSFVVNVNTFAQQQKYALLGS